jgi:hypothetical protein
VADCSSAYAERDRCNRPLVAHVEPTIADLPTRRLSSNPDTRLSQAIRIRPSDPQGTNTGFDCRIDRTTAEPRACGPPYKGGDPGPWEVIHTGLV